VKYLVLLCCLFGLTRTAPAKKEDKLPVRLYGESGREMNEKKEAMHSGKDNVAEKEEGNLEEKKDAHEGVHNFLKSQSLPFMFQKKDEIPFHFKKNTLPFLHMKKESIPFHFRRENIPFHFRRENIPFHFRRENIPFHFRKEALPFAFSRSLEEEEIPFHFKKKEFPSFHIGKKEFPVFHFGKKDEIPLFHSKKTVLYPEVDENEVLQMLNSLSDAQSPYHRIFRRREANPLYANIGRYGRRSIPRLNRYGKRAVYLSDVMDERKPVPLQQAFNLRLPLYQKRGSALPLPYAFDKKRESTQRFGRDYLKLGKTKNSMKKFVELQFTPFSRRYGK